MIGIIMMLILLGLCGFMLVRNYVVYKAQTERNRLVTKANKRLIDEQYDRTNLETKYNYEDQREENWASLDHPSYNAMMFMFSKWKYEDFYPTPPVSSLKED